MNQTQEEIDTELFDSINNQELFTDYTPKNDGNIYAYYLNIFLAGLKAERTRNANNIVDRARLHMSLSRPHPLEKELADSSKLNEELLEKLKERSKQIGVACLEHDLVHSLQCGRCFEEMRKDIEYTLSWSYVAHWDHDTNSKLEAIRKKYNLGSELWK